MLAFTVMLFLLLAGVTAILGYYGMYAPVKISEEMAGGEIVVYKTTKGDYREIRNVMEVVFQKLRTQYGLNPKKSFCVFYNHPNAPVKGPVKAEAGCIITGSETSSLVNLSKHFHLARSIREKIITTEFPMKSEFSLIISYMRIYPKLEKYAHKNDYDPNVPVMEIYDKSRRRIVYRMKIKRNPKSI